MPLVFSPGTYCTGALEIPSGRHVIFEKGAELSFIADFEMYLPVMSRWEGVNCYCMHPLFFIRDAENVIIEDEGILNGNGKTWWDFAFERRAVQPEPAIPIEKNLLR